MKIILYDASSGREMLVQQVVESRGHSPWTGRPLSNQYTPVLVDALASAEAAGAALVRELDKIQGTSPGLTIDEESILGPIRQKLQELNAAGVASQ